MTLAARQKGGFTLPFRMTLQFGSALYQTAVILTRHSGARSCASPESTTPVGPYCSTCGYGFRAHGQEPAPRNDNVDGSRPMRVGIKYGVRLFDRGKQGVEVTAYGHAL